MLAHKKFYRRSSFDMIVRTRETEIEIKSSELRENRTNYAKIGKIIEKNILEKYYATITLQSQT